MLSPEEDASEAAIVRTFTAMAAMTKGIMQERVDSVDDVEETDCGNAREYHDCL
jgi:hypothetical protein